MQEAFARAQQALAMPTADIDRHAAFGGPLRHQIAPQNYEINWQLGPSFFEIARHAITMR
jgi:hypothetical protein